MSANVGLEVSRELSPLNATIVPGHHPCKSHANSHFWDIGGQVPPEREVAMGNTPQTP